MPFPAAIAWLAAPVAHRGLHDAARGVIENGASAVEAAAAAGFAVEIDVQLSADGEAMVFHDDTLDRLTDRAGSVRAHDAAALGAMRLRGGDATIPTLAQILALLAGRVGVVVEIKDQGGALDARGVGPLEDRVAALLSAYPGHAAVMSFNADSMARMAQRAPGVPRGLIGCPAADYDAGPAPDALARMQDLRALATVGAAFVSYAHAALPHPAATAARTAGALVQCWTLRDRAAAARAMAHAHGVTFEGWTPDPPAR